MNTSIHATGGVNRAAVVPPAPPLCASLGRIQLFDPSLPHGPQKFSPRRVVTTRNAMALLTIHEVELLVLLVRHVCGDWGDCCAQDRASSDASIADGRRLMSVFHLSDWREQASMSRQERSGLPTVWAITEHDRTMFLLPEDY